MSRTKGLLRFYFKPLSPSASNLISVSFQQAHITILKGVLQRGKIMTHLISVGANLYHAEVLQPEVLCFWRKSLCNRLVCLKARALAVLKTPY